jgi:hypothetical protein
MATINTYNYPRFLRAYNTAVQAGKDSFVFDEQEILVGYAKYVIEHIKNLKLQGTHAFP